MSKIDIKATPQNDYIFKRLFGKKEGEKEKGLEIAKNLLNIGMEIDKIIEVTGLAKEEIEKIID